MTMTLVQIINSKLYDKAEKLQMIKKILDDERTKGENQVGWISADRDGETPLHAAAAGGHMEIVEALLAVPGIEANRANSFGETPLYAAAIRGHLDIVEALLAVPGIEVNKANVFGETPLHAAAARGHLKVVEALLVHDIEVNRANTLDRPPLHAAAARGHLKVVEALLAARGIEVNRADKNGQTPLNAAAAGGHLKVVEALLAAPGIDVDSVDNDGQTPLNAAAIRGHLEVVNALLVVENGQTPLNAAAAGGYLEVVEALLAVHDIDVNRRDYDGQTPLNAAAAGGYLEVVNALLAVHDIDVDSANNDGQTPLYAAAAGGHLEVVKALLAAPGIEVNRANNFGETPLYRAAFEGRIDVVNALLAVPGIEVNRADSFGETPLHVALAEGNLDIVKALLAVSGIEANRANRFGKYLLHVALAEGNLEIVNALLAVPGIEVNRADTYRRTPLELYLNEIRRQAEEGEVTNEAYQAMQRTVTLFLEKGADLEGVLTRLGLTHQAAAIREGNLFAGLNLMSGAEERLRNFMQRGQSTHDPLVHRTVYLSGKALKQRYHAPLPEAEVLALQAEIRKAASSHQAASEIEAFLAKMGSQNDADLPYWSGGLTMRQAVVCVWKAIHDAAIRYQGFATTEKDIADAEETFFNRVKQSVREDQCVRGGYFNQLMEACAFSQVPGVYVIRMETEKESVVRDNLKSKLDLFEAFALGTEAQQAAILSQEGAYQQFIERLQHNHQLYLSQGNNAQQLTDRDNCREGALEDWVWLSPEALQALAQPLSWTHAEFQAWAAAKQTPRPSTPEDALEERNKELSVWATTLQSTHLEGIWERMGDYYDNLIQQVHEGKRSPGELEATLVDECALLTKKIENPDVAKWVQLFFDGKREALQPLPHTVPSQKSAQKPDEQPPAVEGEVGNAETHQPALTASFSRPQEGASSAQNVEDRPGLKNGPTL